MASRQDGTGKESDEATFELDDAVLEALPVTGTKVLSCHAYGMWVWARQARLICQLPSGEQLSYFLKVTTGESDRLMAEGQFESDKALHELLPSFCPKPYALGQYKAPGPANYFILAEFRDIGQQPPEPARFVARLAELHKKSVSPTGKFGFHVKTCHGKAPQLTDIWEDSWETCYHKQLKHVFDIDKSKQRNWPEFDHCAQLVMDKCIPALLRPLQSDGRSIKPCLVHGNVWDGNTATDMRSGEPFVFDGSAFYAHNEFELGNWRTPRHRLSSKTYIRSYKRHFPASEPEEDWDSRNLLYSLRPNLTAAWLIPGSNYRENVFEDMKELCSRICPDDLASYKKISEDYHNNLKTEGQDDKEEEEEEEEEEQEEEEEEED